MKIIIGETVSENILFILLLPLIVHPDTIVQLPVSSHVIELGLAVP